MFSGTVGERSAEYHRGQRNGDAGGDSADTGGNEHVTGCSHREHDEDHFDALENHGLEGRDQGDDVPVPRCPGARRGQRRGRACKRSSFVVPRHDARGPPHGLSQPAQAEQQEQRTDDQLKSGQRNDAECRPENENNRDKAGKPSGRAEERRAPATHHRRSFRSLGEREMQRVPGRIISFLLS